MLRDVAAAHPINYCALRYFNVAGADPQGRSGQSTAGATHLIKIAVEAATGKREAVSVFGTDFATDDGTGVRDYIHVSDLAAAHVDALDLLIARPEESHTMNCGYGRGYLGAAGARRGRSRDQPQDRAQAGRAPRGRSGRAGCRQQQDPGTLPWRPKHDDLDGIVKDALAWERKLGER